MLLAPEPRLVLLTAGGSQNDAALRHLLNGPLDWVKVLALAQRERAESIVWRRSSALERRAIPDGLREALQRIAMVSDIKMIHLNRLLHRALGALASAGIDVMLLKGGVLAYTSYASFLDRPMGDVDLLVWPEQAEKAWSLLQKEGWKWWSAQFPADRYRRHHHLPPLFDTSAGTVGLEIHRALLPPGHPFRLAPQTLWLRALRITVDGQVVWVPDTLHRLLHLCIHFSWCHEMQAGVWRAFRDVEAITGRAGVGGVGIAAVERTVDWAAFVDLARESRAATCCFWTLRLARSLAGAHVPDGVLRALRPPVSTFVLNSLERHYVLQLFPTESSCPSERLRRRLWELGIAPRWSEHGAARPWGVEWLNPVDQQSSASDAWPQRLLNYLRHAGASMGYLGKITATPSHPAAR